MPSGRKLNLVVFCIIDLSTSSLDKSCVVFNPLRALSNYHFMYQMIETLQISLITIDYGSFKEKYGNNSGLFGEKIEQLKFIMREFLYEPDRTVRRETQIPLCLLFKEPLKFEGKVELMIENRIYSMRNCEGKLNSVVSLQTHILSERKNPRLASLTLKNLQPFHLDTKHHLKLCT